jgi:glycosyltransferase involved in cell wall biosynthesis
VNPGAPQPGAPDAGAETGAPYVLPSVSVCFPAYNEEGTIAGVLTEAHDLLAPSGLDYEILVCDDGSTDRTGAIVDEIAARLPRLRVLHHARNQGIRETFEHLYRNAIKEFVFLNSTDRQWDTRVLFDLMPLTRDWDIVVASRRQKHYGAGRRFVSWGFNVVPRLLFGVRTSDAGAVKIVRREIISRFELVSRSPFNEAERLIRAARAGYRVTAVPTDTLPRRRGRARGLSRQLLFTAIGDVGRVWWSLRGGANVVPSPTVESSSHADRR